MPTIHIEQGWQQHYHYLRILHVTLFKWKYDLIRICEANTKNKFLFISD